jgi:hypothetical protein
MKIKVIIDRNGKTTVDVLNAKGASCVEKTRWIEEKLGGNVSQILKPEYHNEERINVGEEGGAAS